MTDERIETIRFALIEATNSDTAAHYGDGLSALSSLESELEGLKELRDAHSGELVDMARLNQDQLREARAERDAFKQLLEQTEEARLDDAALLMAERDCYKKALEEIAGLTSELDEFGEPTIYVEGAADIARLALGRRP